MKIKRIIAREWLIFLVCVFIGTASYILDDYLSWKKKLDSREITSKEKLGRMKALSTKELLTKEEYLELKELRKMHEPYNYTGIPKEKKTFIDFEPITPEKYKLGEGYSEKGYLLFILYFLSLFIRSIVWSITQLRRKL